MSEEEKRQSGDQFNKSLLYPKFGPGAKCGEGATRQVKNADSTVTMNHKVVGLNIEGQSRDFSDDRNIESGDISEQPCDYFFSTGWQTF